MLGAIQGSISSTTGDAAKGNDRDMSIEEIAGVWIVVGIDGWVIVDVIIAEVDGGGWLDKVDAGDWLE